MRVDRARTAGLVYLTVVAGGLFSLAYVPSQIPLSGDASAAVARVLAHEALFRAGIVAALICYAAFLILPLALYRLLHRIDERAAVLMVALAAVSVPIALAGVQARFGLITIAQQAPALPSDLLAVQVADALRNARGSMMVAQLFWGLWLFPLGWLILKSAVIPRVLGVLLILGGFGYVVTVIGSILTPSFGSLAIAEWIRLPGSVGEIGTALWLSIMGTRVDGREGSGSSA